MRDGNVQRLSGYWSHNVRPGSAGITRLAGLKKKRVLINNLLRNIFMLNTKDIQKTKQNDMKK